MSTAAEGNEDTVVRERRDDTGQVTDLIIRALATCTVPLSAEQLEQFCGNEGVRDAAAVFLDRIRTLLATPTTGDDPSGAGDNPAAPVMSDNAGEFPSPEPGQPTDPTTTQAAPDPEAATPLAPGEIPAGPPGDPPMPPPVPRVTFSLGANGKVNEAYRAALDGKSDSGEAVIIEEVIVPDELGLSFDPATGELHGTPRTAGDFRLELRFRLAAPNAEGGDILEGECRLFVNPDPKTLWKNLPSDQGDPDWKSDEDTLAITGTDGLRMLAASKRGRSHAHVGSFRDDDFSLLHDTRHGWRIITVADGAGSAKKSRKGSLLASRIASGYILKALSSRQGRELEAAVTAWGGVGEGPDRPVREGLYHLFGKAAMQAVDAIADEARRQDLPARDYATTLLIAIHRKFAAGHFFGAYWVGDGGIGLYRRGEGVRVLGKADSGEFAGQTRFLDQAMVTSAEEIWNRVEFQMVPEFTALAVMTDGITDPCFETDANLENGERWDRLWEELEPHLTGANPSGELLSWLDFWSPGNHDDRTIALLYPPPVARKPAEGEESP